MILDAEAAAAFDDMTREGVQEGLDCLARRRSAAGEFVPAVDYLRAQPRPHAA